MCGYEGKLRSARVEKTLLKVCEKCSKHGVIVNEYKAPTVRSDSINSDEEEEIEELVSGYYKVIKQKREFLGLSHNDLAMKISEKESVIQHVENKSFNPSFKTIRKLERFLKTKLIKKETVEYKQTQNQESTKLTLGDFIKIKKKK